jgi:AcrR family transcriptional regulator
MLGAIVRVVSNTFASRRSANRRRRNEAREQILDVARRELKVKPFRELSVDELMQQTGLSRTAFYRYFPDREAVLVDLLEEVWGSLAEARDLEVGTEGIASASSMAGLTELLAENRHVLKAIADAAPGDEDVEQAYHTFMHSYWIEDLTARILSAQEQGLASGLDPELAGEALGWMAERLVTQSLDRDPDQVLDTIIAIVAKTLYNGGGPGGRTQSADAGEAAEAVAAGSGEPSGRPSGGSGEPSGRPTGGSGQASGRPSGVSGAPNGSTDSEATAAPSGAEADTGRPTGRRRATSGRSHPGAASSKS